MSELSQLDELIESDVLDALNEKGAPKKAAETSKEENGKIETPQDLNKDEKVILEDEDIVNKNEISLTNDSSSIQTSDLLSLLNQVLNNKTIEITIKIKD